LLLRTGFRDIPVVIHHQTENSAAGVPTDPAFKFAAREAIFAILAKGRGGGWRGSKKMANCYAQRSMGDDPFNWIKTHPLLLPAEMDGFPFDSAGQGEKSLVMRLYAEAMDLSRLCDGKWYARSAREASREVGARGRESLLKRPREATR
jgi:creatinine amidohydrolase/Fe(II)-dependent formamide hydrolase-like protein